MVSVYFGMDKNAILDIDDYFKNVYEPEWFDDPFVKEMVQDVDNSTVFSRYCIQSPVLGQIPPDMISGGVKACILLLKGDNEDLIDLIACGPNCEKWLSKIFSMKDVRVSMSGYDLSFKGFNVKGICENDGSEIKNSMDWVDKMCIMAGDPKNER